MIILVENCSIINYYQDEVWNDYMRSTQIDILFIDVYLYIQLSEYETIYISSLIIVRWFLGFEICIHCTYSKH